VEVPEKVCGVYVQGVVFSCLPAVLLPVCPPVWTSRMPGRLVWEGQLAWQVARWGGQARRWAAAGVVVEGKGYGERWQPVCAQAQAARRAARWRQQR